VVAGWGERRKPMKGLPSKGDNADGRGIDPRTVPSNTTNFWTRIRRQFWMREDPEMGAEKRIFS